MRSTRPTIWPKRPKPAMITGCPGSSIASNRARLAASASRGSITASCSDSSSGVTIIDIVTTTTSSSTSAGSITPCVTASANSTKANSPPCGSANARPRALSGGMPGHARQQDSTATFTTSRPATTQGDDQRLLEQQAEVGRHADRDEEQAEQQALERLDVGLELVAVLAVGEQHAGEEGAERHRQADGVASAARCRRPPAARPR